MMSSMAARRIDHDSPNLTSRTFSKESIDVYDALSKDEVLLLCTETYDYCYLEASETDFICGSEDCNRKMSFDPTLVDNIEKASPDRRDNNNIMYSAENVDFKCSSCQLSERVYDIEYPPHQLQGENLSNFVTTLINRIRRALTEEESARNNVKAAVKMK